MVHKLPENFNISDFDVFHSALMYSRTVHFADVYCAPPEMCRRTMHFTAGQICEYWEVIPE